MAFELEHTVVSTSFTPTVHKAGGDGFGTVNVEGEMQLLHPGRLDVGAIARFEHRTRVELPPGPGGEDPGSDPQGGRFKTETIAIPVRVTLYTPDGHEFTGSEVRLADLRRVRDLRGSPIGPWRYKLSGESEHRSLDDLDTIRALRGFFVVKVIETVRSESAGPLVSGVSLDGSRQSVEFDLFRVGTLVAELSNVTAGWRGTLSLVDPDGVSVRSTFQPMLTFPVELATLAKSRGADGSVRRWRLEVAPQGGVVVGTGNGPKLSATVIGTGRITTAVLQSRIEHLLGPRGRFIRIYGENAGGDALARLRITDTAAAEAIDMHSLLEKPLERAEQDPDVDIGDIQANVVYTLARGSQDIGFGTSIDVSSLRVGTIDVVVGPGVRLGATVPAVRLKVGVAGRPRSSSGPRRSPRRMYAAAAEMEVGVAMAPDGTPQTVSWTTDAPFDIDLHWGTVLGLGAIAGPLIAFGVLAFTELLEGVFNGRIASGAREMFADANLAPRILMTIFGAHLRYRAIRVEGGTFVFEHVAPLEHDPARAPAMTARSGARSSK